MTLNELSNGGECNPSHLTVGFADIRNCTQQIPINEIAMGQMKAVLFKITLTFDRIKFNGLHLMLLR